MRSNVGRFLSRPLADRFWEKVNKTPECWLWEGKINAGGYGRVRIGKVESPAHHASYYLKIGEWIPDGYEPDHTCKTRNCVRVGPGHVEIIPKEIHQSRTALTHRNALKTKCIRGHERWALHKDGRRYCMDCNLLRVKGLI